jgi:hypothetical protein
MYDRIRPLTLFDDGTHVNSLVPPSGLSNGLVRTSLRTTERLHQPTCSRGKHDRLTYVSRNGTHDGQVIGSDDLLHLLDASQVPKHVSVSISRWSEPQYQFEDMLQCSPDRDDVARLDQSGGKLHGFVDRPTGHGLGPTKMWSLSASLYTWKTRAPG